MSEWRKLLLTPDADVRRAIEVIDATGRQIVLVVEEGKLVGAVTDGDIRRAILRGITLDHPVCEVMNPRPVVAYPETTRQEMIDLLTPRKLHHIPVVDREGTLLGMETLDELIRPHVRENPVILMAGGLGTRLMPLTDETPKPLLKVGDRPIIETIIGGLADCGFRKFFLMVNYKADMMEAIVGDGSRWGIDIRYIREEKRLGTAGALGLLPEKPAIPALVMNADLLTKVNVPQLFDFMGESGAAAVMGVREFDFQIPYGVVNIDGGRIVSIDEKPVQRFYVNAGIYVLGPAVFDFIPHNEWMDMPDLFSALIGAGLKADVFPIREYWLDIGKMDDYRRANKEFFEEFS